MEMKKQFVFFLFLFSAFGCMAQADDVLLVYAVKGRVTVTENGQESPVKTGRVLHVNDVIKTEKGATLTMICSRGRPLSISREGVFPVKMWRDSCNYKQHSISSSYFRYIWGQLYSYSPENKAAAAKKSDMAVIRGEDPDMLKPAAKKKSRLSISKGMDTVFFFNKLQNFPLSWNGMNYKGTYTFTVYDAKGVKVLFRDTLRASYIAISQFSDRLQPGKMYRWNVAMKGAGVSRKRVLYYHPGSDMADNYISSLKLPEHIMEDSASASFRVAYMLEKKHYLESALLWYELANAAAPEPELFRDQLIRFRNEFWIR